MKARLLKNKLNNTGYIVNNKDKYIAVGSPMCHNLISMDKKTLVLKYSLDTFNEGRSALNNKELLFIWDKLVELIKTGEIYDIINGKDEIENSLPVYTVEDYQLVETFTDKYGWPNVTINGDIMYDNIYFKTREQAIEYGIKEYEACVRLSESRLAELSKKIYKIRKRIKKSKECIERFLVFQEFPTAEETK